MIQSSAQPQKVEAGVGRCQSRSNESVLRSTGCRLRCDQRKRANFRRDLGFARGRADQRLAGLCLNQAIQIRTRSNNRQGSAKTPALGTKQSMRERTALCIT
jgi:hypothetical protein